MSNYPDNFTGTNMDKTGNNAFEPIRLGECDDCGYMERLNEYSLCKQCDEAAGKLADALNAEAFRHTYNKGFSAFRSYLKTRKERIIL